jgi:DNA-binding IclR family transcriptional regulator
VAAGWQGREVAVHATSTGKVLLAYSHPADIPLLLGVARGRRLPRYNQSTITSLTSLEKELALTRERGYAVCRGEFESTAWGVSAPVLDVAGRPVAVVSLWGPSERLTEDRFEELGKLAVFGAAEIAGRAA